MDETPKEKTSNMNAARHPNECRQQKQDKHTCALAPLARILWLTGAGSFGLGRGCRPRRGRGRRRLLSGHTGGRAWEPGELAQGTVFIHKANERRAVVGKEGLQLGLVSLGSLQLLNFYARALQIGARYRNGGHRVCLILPIARGSGKYFDCTKNFIRSPCLSAAMGRQRASYLFPHPKIP